MTHQTEAEEPRDVQEPLVSVVMPCLNEEEAIGACIEKIQRTFAAAGIAGEIVVCDNGSTDASVAIAERMGARVVHQPHRGYGNAYLKGFASARGRYLVMGDADDTYDFTHDPAVPRRARPARGTTSSPAAAISAAATRTSPRCTGTSATPR